jgi:predicted ATP-dependent protease
VILPCRNEHDLEEVPEEVRNSMTFIPVDKVTAVLEAALMSVTESGSGGDGSQAAESKAQKENAAVGET